VASLPVLTRVSSLPTNTLDRILLAHMLSEMKYRGSVCRSQRDYGEIFNRIDSARFSRSRRLLERDGWVHRSALSVGDKSDCYEKGIRLSDHPYLCRGWMSLAHNLWGRDGLLTRWSGSSSWGSSSWGSSSWGSSSWASSGWGSGCLGVSGMLVLATVERSELPLSRMDISKYLEMFCSYESVRRCVNKLIDLNVFVESESVLCMSDNWHAHLQDFFASAYSGMERLLTGNKRRQKERVARRQTVERGFLTDAERGQLRSLGCWVSGCRSKSKQADHFPPMRFLDLFKDQWSPHILFSACGRHNAGFGNFIASLPELIPERRQYVFTDGEDPMRLFRASNNLCLVKFKKHADERNLAAASAVAKRSLDFFYALQIDGFASESCLALPMNESRARRRKGSAVVNKKTTFESQIYGGN
jgi:hypothetical protein